MDRRKFVAVGVAAVGAVRCRALMPRAQATLDKIRVVMMSDSFNPAAAGHEFGAHAGARQDVRNRQSRDAYDRHFDYGSVLDGDVWLEFDDGKQVHLRPHDVVVQNGTRHVWRNKSDRPVKMAFVLIGARRNA